MSMKTTPSRAASVVFRAGVIVLALLSTGWPILSAERPRIDLKGKWQFKLDPQNQGETAQWHSASVPFADSIQVPADCRDSGSMERQAGRPQIGRRTAPRSRFCERETNRRTRRHERALRS